MRKTSQAALLVLLEQDLIERGDMEEHVCPVIIQLSCEDSSDDYRTEAVAVSIYSAPCLNIRNSLEYCGVCFSSSKTLLTF